MTIINSRYDRFLIIEKEMGVWSDYCLICGGPYQFSCEDDVSTQLPDTQWLEETHNHQSKREFNGNRFN